MTWWLFLFLFAPLPSFSSWMRHKDQQQCYLVSPPPYQSGPRLVGIDSLCSEINAHFHSYWYSKDRQRYTTGETRWMQHYAPKGETINSLTLTVQPSFLTPIKLSVICLSKAGLKMWQHKDSFLYFGVKNQNGVVVCTKLKANVLEVLRKKFQTKLF